MSAREQAVAAVRRLSLAAVALGGAFVVAIAAGLATADPATGSFRDGMRLVMEGLTVVSATVLLPLGVALCFVVDSSKRVLSATGAAWLFACAILTCAVHFVSLTVAGPLVHANLALEPLLALGWPSVLMSLDILAWDGFFGLGFLFLGLAFLNPAEKALGWLMVASGSLSLLGLVALPLGNMGVRFIGVFGYTVLLTVACGFLFLWSGRQQARGTPD